MPARIWWVAGALALGCSCSPYGGGSFACTDDTQCPPNGICATGFCAFPDPSCDSQFKYGEHSGPSSGQCVGATNDVDAAVDADETPTPDGATCYGAGLVHACFASAPTGTVTISNNTVLNTDTSTMCATLVGANANAWCVLAGTTITVEPSFFLAGTGSKPLVLIATDTISIQGLLDVASHRQFASIGAGADAAGCNAGTPPTMTSGGAGGSFGGKGGNGGNNLGGTGGISGNTLTPTALRGGCPGQNGGGTGAGAGGHGGGAVWLFAGTSITVGGAVNASGGGGDPGGDMSGAGGGGGGAGGFVGLESPTINVTGTIFANGGGGGEACGNQSTGCVGGGDAMNAGTAATGGGNNSSFGSDGGSGSVGATLTGQPGSNVCTGACTTGSTGPVSGGGGGGGAGIIKVVPTKAIPNTSPPET